MAGFSICYRVFREHEVPAVYWHRRVNVGGQTYTAFDVSAVNPGHSPQGVTWPTILDRQAAGGHRDERRVRSAAGSHEIHLKGARSGIGVPAETRTWYLKPRPAHRCQPGAGTKTHQLATAST